MTEPQRKLYVGIDVHSKEHIAAVLPVGLLQQPGSAWKKVKPFSIRNNAADFNRLDSVLRSQISSTKEVAVAVDYTGGHYSEPIIYFLQARGYDIYCLEAKAVKGARERFLDEESKSDVIDSTSSAYLLYLRDLHGSSFRITAMTPDLGSRATALNSLMLQRLQFNKLANQATNRLHQLLLAVFPEGEARFFKQLITFTSDYPTPRDILNSDGLKSVSNLPQKDKDTILDLAATTIGIPSDIYSWLIKDLTNQRREALAKRDVLTSILRTEVRAHPYGHILLSFPYVGEIAAATIISVIKEIDRWPDKKKFRKALGVYNSLTQSGSGIARTRRGKEGSRHGRRVLF